MLPCKNVSTDTDLHRTAFVVVDPDSALSLNGAARRLEDLSRGQLPSLPFASSIVEGIYEYIRIALEVCPRHSTLNVFLTKTSRDEAAGTRLVWDDTQDMENFHTAFSRQLRQNKLKNSKEGEKIQNTWKHLIGSMKRRSWANAGDDTKYEKLNARNRLIIFCAKSEKEHINRALQYELNSLHGELDQLHATWILLTDSSSKHGHSEMSEQATPQEQIDLLSSILIETQAVVSTSQIIQFMRTLVQSHLGLQLIKVFGIPTRPTRSRSIQDPRALLKGNDQQTRFSNSGIHNFQPKSQDWFDDNGKDDNAQCATFLVKDPNAQAQTFGPATNRISIENASKKTSGHESRSNKRRKRSGNTKIGIGNNNQANELSIESKNCISSDANNNRDNENRVLELVWRSGHQYGETFHNRHYTSIFTSRIALCENWTSPALALRLALDSGTQVTLLPKSCHGNQYVIACHSFGEGGNEKRNRPGIYIHSLRLKGSQLNKRLWPPISSKAAGQAKRKDERSWSTDHEAQILKNLITTVRLIPATAVGEAEFSSASLKESGQKIDLGLVDRLTWQGPKDEWMKREEPQIRRAMFGCLRMLRHLSIERIQAEHVKEIAAAIRGLSNMYGVSMLAESPAELSDTYASDSSLPANSKNLSKLASKNIGVFQKTEAVIEMLSNLFSGFASKHGSNQIYTASASILKILAIRVRRIRHWANRLKDVRDVATIHVGDVLNPSEDAQWKSAWRSLYDLAGLRITKREGSTAKTATIEK
mmetsp:Transcript_10913/g.26755  ORF Transcript_10913/g.26755 Transcript_10913/m.26755 type:complete len:762 (+) Transcript_10913:72-2357(+)